MLHKVPDAHLLQLYSGALAYLTASKYEGFGFPGVEAMACGAPVLASDIPVFREVLGSGAKFLPLDIDAWVSGLGDITSEAVKTAAVEQSSLVRQRFSWAEAAKKDPRAIPELMNFLAGACRSGTWYARIYSPLVDRQPRET